MGSFRFAFEGIRYVVKTEQNMQIHIGASALVIMLGLYFKITAAEWIILIMLIAGMFSLELINTAIEQTVNLVTRKKHPLAKAAKDAAAGAVLVYAAASLIAGILIFWKYIFS